MPPVGSPRETTRHPRPPHPRGAAQPGLVDGGQLAEAVDGATALRGGGLPVGLHGNLHCPVPVGRPSRPAAAAQGLPPLAIDADPFGVKTTNRCTVFSPN